jgi:hypothetical protein
MLAEVETPATAPRKKATHVGAPACFVLEREVQFLHRAFDGHCYLVGSALERPDWRDIDVRMIMDDEAFVALFPDAGPVDHATGNSTRVGSSLPPQFRSSFRGRPAFPSISSFSPAPMRMSAMGRPKERDATRSASCSQRSR